MMNEYNLQIAEFLIRLFLGILFFFQGYDKLFRVKMPAVIETFIAAVDRTHIPRPLLNIVAYYTSIAEFVGGLMLITGFFTSFALYALGLDLLLVSFAFTYIQPMWDMQYVLPRFLLVIVLLILPPNYQLFSLDHLLHLK